MIGATLHRMRTQPAIPAPSTSRLPSVDVLRIAVVVMVVFRHTYPAGDDQLLIASVSVPFFFFLTGWLWRPGRRSLIGEVRNRWRTLGVPYLGWFLLTYIVWLPWAWAGADDVGEVLRPLLGGAFAGRPFTTFWFISALFVVAVLMRLTEKLSPVVLAILACGVLLSGAFLGGLLVKVPLGIGVAVPAFGFAVLGWLAHRYLPRGPGAWRWAAVSLPVLLVVSLPLGHIDIKYGLLGTPLLSAVVAATFAWAAISVLDGVFSRFPVPPRVCAAFSGLARVAIVPVLLHPVVLWVLDAPLVGAHWWVFAVAVVAPWGLALLLSRWQWSRWLVARR